MIAHPLSVASIGAVTEVFYHRKEGLSNGGERKLYHKINYFPISFARSI